MSRRNYETTTANRSTVSSAALSTGDSGCQARSNQARLERSFPDSPMWSGYTETEVSMLRAQLVTNQIGDDPVAGDEIEPRAQAQAYWGFSDPAEVSLDYSARGFAPDLDGDTTTDVEGDILHSYLGPNLLPPPLSAPTTAVTETVLPELNSSPPFVGNGKANPRATSINNKTKLVGSQATGNIPLWRGPTQPFGTARGTVGTSD